MTDSIAVYMLDIGQGDCSVVLLPDDSVVVFDCADAHVLRKVLDNWGTRTIAAFVLSHLDNDHIAGALNFLKGWPYAIGNVHLSADRDITADHEEARKAKSLVDHAKEQARDEGARRRRWELVTNERDPRPLAAGHDWSVRLLAPSHVQQMERERDGAWEDANRYSSILRVQVGPNAMLIGGDAPLLSWSELPKEELPASVFRIPHHGGALSDGGIPAGWEVDRLYSEVGAKTALMSVGTNNGNGHPSERWVKPLIGSTSCRLLCTQVTARCHAPLEITGADGVSIRDPVEIKTLRARVITKQNQWVEPQYRHLTDKRMEIITGRPEVPCAGTVLVTLFSDRVEVVPPTGGEHLRIIDGWKHPLCRSASA